MFDFLLYPLGRLVRAVTPDVFSEQGKMRRHATNWLEMAERVYDYRLDELSEAQGLKLQTVAGELKSRLKDKAAAGTIKAAIEKLETVMREVGGRIYPTSSIVENVEFFLVAAIVILGMRAYFVQPFKIPTNSMWPTYYGMTSEVFKPGEEPGLLRKAGRLAGLGAINYSMKAPVDGELMIPVFRDYRPAFTEKPGRSMFIFPTTIREYTFLVSGQEAKIKVPADFDFDRVMDEVFKGSSDSLYSAMKKAADQAPSLESSTMRVRGGTQPVDARVYWVPIGKKVHKGENILSFDILTGDLLFVDRLTYNFFPPKVGSGFVFKTENINSPEMQDSSGVQISQYYVKRLVGVPGDTLEIRQPLPAIADGKQESIKAKDGQLFRNGQPIDGAPAFAKNARKDGLYPGYTADGSLGFGQIVNVPGNSYYAMGDNSPRSKDSRYWGFVPDKDVVGRPLFIYYPLTSRWGLAK